MREICQSGFDEREQETEPGQTGLRRRRESFVSSHRETKTTAPVLDSTPLNTHNAPGPRGSERNALLTTVVEKTIKLPLRNAVPTYLKCCQRSSKMRSSRVSGNTSQV